MIWAAPLVFGIGLGSLLMYLLSIAPTGALKHWTALVLGLVGMIAFGIIGNTYVWPAVLQKETPILAYILGLGISTTVWTIIPITLIREMLRRKFLRPPETATAKDDETIQQVIMRKELSKQRVVDPQLEQDVERLRACRQSKKFTEALQIGKQLEAHESFNSVAIIAEELAKTFFAMKLYDGAVRYFNKAIKIERNNPDLHYSLGLAYQRAGKNEAAAKELEEANLLDRDNAQILTFLGYAYFSLGSTEKAINVTERATKINPRFKKASNNLAYYYAEAGRKLDDALQIADRLVSSEPENAQYLSTKGKVHFVRNEIDQAIEYLEKANTLEPNNPYITENLSQAYKRKGELTKATSE